MTAVSAPGFRFSGTQDAPDAEAGSRATLATVAALPCDVLLAPHPAVFDRDAKLERLRRAAEDEPAAGARENPFVDPEACRRYAAQGPEALDRRIARERGEAQE